MSFKAAIQKHYRKKTVVPKGWLLIPDIASELGVSRPRAQNIVRQMIHDGVAERQRITKYSAEGTGSLAYVYRIKK